MKARMVKNNRISHGASIMLMGLVLIASIAANMQSVNSELTMRKVRVTVRYIHIGHDFDKSDRVKFYFAVEWRRIHDTFGGNFQTDKQYEDKLNKIEYVYLTVAGPNAYGNIYLSGKRSAEVYAKNEIIVWFKIVAVHNGAPDESAVLGHIYNINRDSPRYEYIIAPTGSQLAGGDAVLFFKIEMS